MKPQCGTTDASRATQDRCHASWGWAWLLIWPGVIVAKWVLAWELALLSAISWWNTLEALAGMALIMFGLVLLRPNRGE